MGSALDTFIQEPLELMMVTFYVTLNGFVIILFND